ncbi:MAG TPA: glycosyltransferase family 39 protein [Myxococcota bacterium]|jgi:4-amino-4-deoxy-L-arabinose transferase-like glycosyltransferase
MSSLRPLGAGVLAAAAALFLVRLGAVDLWAPDEPRYAQIAEELRSFEHGARGLWLLHLNGEAYTQKPPLYFWLAALAGAPAGRVDELAARLPSALAGIACVALVMQLGARLRGPAVGIAAGGLLGTATLFTHLARRAQLDVLLCGFELIALAAFWRIDRGGPHRTRDAAALHGALGLAVLTKGPVGLILPALAIVAFLAWERRLSDLRRCLPPWAPLLSVAPGLVWIAGAVALAPPGFAQAALYDNVWGRFAHGTSHAGPPWYYLYRLPLDFLPWTLLAPAVVVAGRRALGAEGPAERARVWRFLLAWLGSAFLFFSVSGGKRGLYLLPAFPAAALLCADAVVSALREGARPPRWVPPLLAGAAALVLLAGLAAPRVASRFGIDLPAGFAPSWLALGGASALAYRAARASWLRRAGVVVAGVALAELLVFGGLFPALDVEKSPRSIARAAAELAGPGESVGVTRGTLVGALAYYGRRRVTELETPEAILRFLASGGRVIVTEARNLDRLEAVAPVEVRFRVRQGRRALVVVTPVPPAEGSSP